MVYFYSRRKTSNSNVICILPAHKIYKNRSPPSLCIFIPFNEYLYKGNRPLELRVPVRLYPGPLTGTFKKYSRLIPSQPIQFLDTKIKKGSKKPKWWKHVLFSWTEESYSLFLFSRKELEQNLIVQKYNAAEPSNSIIETVFPSDKSDRILRSYGLELRLKK